MTITQQQPKKRALDYIKEEPTPERVASYHWYLMEARGKRSGSYEGVDLKISRDDFLDFVRSNWSSYIRVYNNWKDAAFDRRLSPTVDRINSKGHYERGNLRFLSFSDNVRAAKLGHKLSNETRTKLSQIKRSKAKQYCHNGVCQSLTEWSEQTGIKFQTLRSRLQRYGWSFYDAITTKKYGKHN